MSATINLNDKCIKCGRTFRQQMFMVRARDAGVRTFDPSECPEGGDHEFRGPEEMNDE